MDGLKASIEKTNWSDVRTQVKKLNPNLTEIIDRLDPPYPLYKAPFPFGAEFIRQGRLFLPNDHGDIVSLNDAIISKEIKDELSYNIGTNPIHIITHKSI